MQLPIPYRYLSVAVLLCVVLLAGLQSVCRAQPLPLPQLSTLPQGVSVNFSFAQATSMDWAQGDENLLALKFSCRTRIEQNFDPFIIKNTFVVALGATYQNDSVPDRAVRVTDNEVFGEMMIVSPLHWKIDPYVAANFRTAITESFRYTGTVRSRTMSLWDPVTSQQSAGFTYGISGKESAFSTRLGFVLQQIRASIQTTLTDDPITRGIIEAYKPQSGVEFINEGIFRQDSMITFTAKFGLFSSFDDFSVWTVRFESETRFTIWKSFGLTWTFNVLHDVRQSLRTQFKESVMLGLAVAL